MGTDIPRPTGASGSRVTCPACALHDNIVVVCNLANTLLGVRATCPVCGHSERVVAK